MEVERVDRMVGSAEAISDAVGSASRLVGGAVASPFIKVVAFGAGINKGIRLVRGGAATGNGDAGKNRRRRKRTASNSSRPAAPPGGRLGLPSGGARAGAARGKPR